MSVITPKSVVKKKDNIPIKEIDDEAFILDLETGDYFSLNETGRFIWSRLDGKISVEDIAKKLAFRYGASEKEALSDVLEFLKILRSKKLISDIG